MNANEILEGLPDGVVVVGPDRTIVDMNRVAERLTGWRKQDAVGRFYGEVLRLRDAAGFLVHEKADPFTTAPTVSRGTPEREYMLHRHGGDERWVAVRTSFHRSSGKVDHVVATLRDLARRQGMERSAYDLIATLAHDLRAPLTSVKGFTSTILRNWDRFSDEQIKHMLETIDWDADRMERLLKDLLDFSRLEAGRLELKRTEFDLAEMVGAIAGRIAMNAREHSVETHFPTPFPPVFADKGKVEQVVANLVENAVKHGDPGLVRVAGESSPTQVTVRVEDSGPGIEERHRPYVFTKFYSRATGERHHGTGLGLYICKGIIEAHGGDIRIERSEPSGTVFAFTLPLEQG